MAEWLQFDPSKLLPEELTTAVDDIQALVNLLRPAIEIATEFLTALIATLQDYSTATEILIKEAYDIIVLLVNSIIQTLTQTGVYKLTYFTPSFSHFITPSEWLMSVGKSLYDKMDERRPILIDPDAYVGSIIVMATADNLKDLMENFNNFFLLLQGLVASLTQVSSWPTYPDEFQVEFGVGKEPNWSSIKIADIVPGLNQICNMLVGMVNNLLPPQPTSDVLNAAVTLLANKITELQAFLTKILAVIQIISAILSFEGVFILPVAGTGDADWLYGQWNNTIGGPLDVENATYTVGGVFLVTGGTNAATLFSFFGLPVPS